jgi:predicted nucleic acid-binding protein
VILVDLNVVLDVVQKREPHHRASAAILSAVVRDNLGAALPAHAFTTVHYIVTHYQNRAKADDVIDWLLQYFHIATTGHAELVRARELGWPDFEDAVVAANAESMRCETIVTRNVADFKNSPIPVMTPHEMLLKMDS